MKRRVASGQPQAKRVRQWRTVSVAVLVALSVGLWAVAPAALAQVNTGIDFGTSTGLTTVDIRITVARIIRAFLGLLGVVGLGIVLTGGFLWMTSGGNEEKITQAKKLLANGAIGLTIVLLSFSITQFVISRLVAALNASSVRQASVVEVIGRFPPIALPGGCVDPGGAAPVICSVEPASPRAGAFLTIRGYRFGQFTATGSRVQFGTVDAILARCEGQPSWDEHTIVAVVPPELAPGRSTTLTVTAGSGLTAPSRTLTIAAGTPGPGIACIIPDSGVPGGPLAIWGQGFGDARGDSAVTFGGGARMGETTAWAPLQIQGVVPVAAETGPVTVTVGGVASNPYPFTVTCSAATQCGSGCCMQEQCVEAAACAAPVPPPPPPPDGGAEGPVITGISPQTLVDPATGTSYRRPEDVPEGVRAVVAPNGAAGNFLTIRGRGFGDAPGTITFLGGAGDGDDRVAPLASCVVAWADGQVIVAVPEGAAVGPIRLVTAASDGDVTDDARGAVFEHFRPNGIRRPGLCGVDPGSGTVGATVALAGVQFGDAQATGDAVYFGDRSSGAIADSAWSPTAIAASVPNIAEGAVEVRVAVDGELSNAVAFTRAPEPRVPRIAEIVPADGGPGQYVTIRGEHFGSEIGKVTFTRGSETYEVIPRFPDACRQDWWRESEITIRIPANRTEWGPPEPSADGFTPAGEYAVRVQPSGTDVRSNPAPFTVNGDTPTPGICAIVPASGPARTTVRLIGERFGAEGTIAFTPNQRVGAEDKAGGATPFAWEANEVRGVRVPSNATTGSVQLWAGADVTSPGGAPTASGAERGSNPVTFEVRDCRQGATCGEGTTCCGDGTCSDRCAADGPTAGAYQWTFSTGVVPRVPRVVEACEADGRSSPSPWDRQGQGSDVCGNALVRVQFTSSMAMDSEDAARALTIARCTGGTNIAGTTGGFDAPASLTGWRILESADGTPLQSNLLRARHEVLAAGSARSENPADPRGVLVIEKVLASAAGQPRTTDLPRDVALDRHYFAIEAPPALIPSTDGITYTARVFVRGANPNRNPNMRAGLVIGRAGGDAPAAAGWYQQVAEEITIDGTWQELRAQVVFDSGANRSAPGFLRLYVTSPPPGEPVGDDDGYAVRFDDLSIQREGDPCAVTVPAEIGATTVVDEPGRTRLQDNVITVAPPTINGRRGWRAGTWYEVVVAGDGSDALRAADAPKLSLDGDGDGAEGGNYRFRFRTRDNPALCAPQSIITTPATALATQPGPDRGALTSALDLQGPGLVHVRADGVSDPRACYSLEVSGGSWSWDAEQPSPPDRAVVEQGGRWCLEDADCGVLTCASDADCAGVGGSCNGKQGICVTDSCSGTHQCTNLPNTATVQAKLETPIAADGTPDPVNIRATLAGIPPRTGTSAITVRFEQPRVVEAYPVPACQEACPNARIAAVFNVALSESASTAVVLARCTNESCRRDQLEVVPANVRVCPKLPLVAGAEDPCAGIRLNAEAQLVVVPSDALLPNRSYRVIVRGGAGGVKSAWSVPLSGLQFSEDASGEANAYSWTFRTRTEACAVREVVVQPETVHFRAIGERARVAAVPLSAPDRCSPFGQPLASAVFGWEMQNADGTAANATVAGFTTVASGGGFVPAGQASVSTLTSTTFTDGGSCTAQCLRPGSRRLLGICGNNVVDVVAEECDRGSAARDAWFADGCDIARCLRTGARPIAAGGTCGNGAVDVGEECDRVDVDGAPSAQGTFPVWCDPGTCLLTGARPGSAVCGNNDIGDGEDCDDGNTRSGDGCSAVCLREGTPPMRSSAFPNGVAASCGDGVVAAEEECDLGSQTRILWLAAGCDFNQCVRTGAQPVPAGGTCGNGVVDVGEQCDDGMAGTCAIGAPNGGAVCATDAECGDGGTCEDPAPVGGDGCSATCLLEGSSIAWRNAVTGVPQPSICGDGEIPTYDAERSSGGEACDAGTPSGIPDASQLLEAIGTSTTDADGFQRATVRASVGAGAVSGSAKVELQCGFRSDAECPSGAYGVDRAGCCALRPLLVEQTPEAEAANVCRNTRIALRFDRALDPASVAIGVALDRCLAGVGCDVNADADWESVVVRPALVAGEGETDGAETVVELPLTQPLDAGRMYRMRVLGSDADADGVARSIRAGNGVRFAATTAWRFTAGAQVCAIDRIQVTPPTAFLNTRESQAELRAEAFARTRNGSEAITPVTGYTWEYAWETSDAAIAAVTATGDTGDMAVAAPATPAQNGDALATARATVTESVIGGVGVSFTGTSKLRVFLCENPWPAVRDGSWAPYALPGENVSIAYCRDQGDRTVCKTSPNATETGAERTCANDAACLDLGDSYRCLRSRSDDLPAFDATVVERSDTPTNSDRDELWHEFFFLPRDVSYCSASGQRCDPAVPATCPAEEICRSGQDAIGVRIYENSRHVDAERWFQTQGFTGAPSAIAVDGYRGVRAGGSTYVNVGNVNTVSTPRIVFTNLLVLSANEGAVSETNAILDQILAGIRFTTNLSTIADKAAFSRDIRRVEDLVGLHDAIAIASETNRQCSVTPAACTSNDQCPSGETCVARAPTLEAGTYIPGMTTSRWPSWAVELGRAIGAAVPSDPLNAFSGACVATEADQQKYDPATCWSQELGTYACPVGSHVYQYRRTASDWSVGGVLEYAQASQFSPAIVGGVDFSGGICANTPYSVSGRCGDGALNSDNNEACDPPGASDPIEPVCTTDSGRTGVQFRTCGRDCQWTAYSACSANCGNTRVDVDTGEQCDVGARGGRVRPTAGTVPGITSGTQYECSMQCTWAGGYCGDGAVQGTFGEQCDGTANVATTSAASSPTTRYACTTAADPTPCRATGGYCGDRVKNGTEVCDGDETESCLTTENAARRGVDLATGSPNWDEDNAAEGWGQMDDPGAVEFLLQIPAVNVGSSHEVRMTIETSNGGADLSGLSRDVIAQGSPSVSAFSPSGETGIWHRMEVSTSSGSTTTAQGTIWARATGPDRHQTTTLVLQGLGGGANRVRINWTNDWLLGALDANLRVYRVTFAANRVRACGVPGTESACNFPGSWSTCRAAGAACGNGTVDAGEMCDDGGQGRCSNDGRRTCRADAECGPGGTCDQNADACTERCERNVCGDAFALSSTCVGGDAAGRPCTTNADCGRNGECRSEACDLGASNWRQQCTDANDAQCVGNAVCPYGRTCNYCLQNTCAIVTKQGGFCGDLVLQGNATPVRGPEVCDFVAGTDQVQTITTTAQLDWGKEICTASCTSKCPPTYANQAATFAVSRDALASTVPTLTLQSNDVNADDRGFLVVNSCRLLGGLTVDVALGDGIDIWPTPIAVVIVTDRSGSMGGASGTDVECDDDAERESRMECARKAVADPGALIDALATARGRNEVKVGLVSFESTSAVDSPLRDVSILEERTALQTRVQSYRENPNGGTSTHLGINEARALLDTDTTARTKVIVLLSDGAANDAAATAAAATAFKGANRYLFAIAFPNAIAGMTEWSSGDGFAFAGSNLRSFYDQIVGAIAGVAIRIGLNLDNPSAPSTTTFVDESRDNLPLNVAGFETTCAANGQPTVFDLRAVFRARQGHASDAIVTITQPSARVCMGPPWKP